MAGFQFSFGSKLSLGQRYARTLAGQGQIHEESDRGKRIWNFVLALIKDVVLPQVAISLFPLLLSLIASHFVAKGTPQANGATLGAILIPLAAVIWTVSRNLAKGKWYWAILNVVVFIYITVSTKVPASVLAAYNTNGRVFAIEACALPVIIVFLIGSWKRFATGCITCVISWALWLTVTYYFLAFDFYIISDFGSWPLVSPHSYVKVPPYDFVVVAWSASGIEALIITLVAALYIGAEAYAGLLYIVYGTYPRVALS